MPREVPTLNLEEVSVLATSQSPAHEYFHVFGILRQECQHLSGICWTLYDEFKEIDIRLAGTLTQYPRPKPGDVIRIHRLTINKHLHTPEIPHPKNVVIWPAFQHEPQPISFARAPTIRDDDIRRRRILEAFFTSKIDRIKEFQISSSVLAYYNVAGWVEDLRLDSFGHMEVDFADGTGHSCIRVFAKLTDKEDDVHFKEAVTLKIGDFFAATNAKFDRNGKKLNLSANRLHGRSLRHVEKSSILGAILSQSLGKINEPYHGNNSHLQTQSDNIGNGASTRRRSPRLLQQQTSLAPTNDSPTHSVKSVSSQAHTSPPSNGSRETFPTYTQFSDLRPREVGYEFHDIVGQVREDPQLTVQYGNYVIQIYDGSMHNFTSFYSYEVKHVLEGCLILCVYSKQKDSDTDEHIEMAKKLKEGDLIYVRNVRVSFRNGKIKLELSANRSHNKSINVIDKDSMFGRKLLDIVETPPVEELREMIDPSSSSQE